MRVPDGGIQPQAAVDPQGVLHLLYFKGEDAKAGDLSYCTLTPGANDFSPSRRVNSQPKSAIAAGTIRGGQLALGQGGRVHAVWNSSGRGKDEGVFYTRMNAAGDGFEPQRNLVRVSAHIDGGATLAADPAGHVYVAWHAVARGTHDAPRQVWLAASADGGATFTEDRPVSDAGLGACPCCSLRALASSDGTLYLFYRSGTTGVQRDMHLLTSRDRGQTFTGAKVDPWEIKTCPMSSGALLEAGPRVLMAWETNRQIRFGALSDAGTAARQISRGSNCKHPTLAVDEAGRILAAWSEGAKWGAGGSTRWRVLDADGRPIVGTEGTTPELPVWSFPAAAAQPGGGFLVIY